MWYFKEENGSFAIDSIPMVEVDGVLQEDTGWVMIDTRPLPYDDYVFDGIKWVAKVVQPTIINTVSDIQLRLALNELGMLASVEAFANSDITFKIWWDRALTINKTNPILVAGATAMGLTQEQIDNIFTLASMK